MAKVLLIQPNYDLTNPYHWKSCANMPLALATLATYIRDFGSHKTVILDRNLDYDNPKLIELIKRFNPDIVGLTAYTSPMLKDVQQVSRIIKENSTALVLVGGTHATLEPKSLLDFKYIDYVVRGEGEEPLLEICNLVDKNELSSKNIIKLKNINENALRPLLDLRKCPHPDYDIIEVKRYPFAIFCTSRGCPGKCKFCYNQGKQLRFYDTDKTIEMFDKVISKYDIHEFVMVDDNFANLSNRSTRLCEALSKHNCIFFSFLRADLATDKVLINLKKAGCFTVQIGFESANQRMLDFMNKLTTVEQNIKAVKMCKKYGIFVEGSFMIGMPTETAEEARDTIKFIENTKIPIAFTKIYKPFPSTDFWDYCISHDLIKKPSNLNEWIEFCDINPDNANLNVSNIPREILLNYLKRANKHDKSQYLKKLWLFIRKGHYGYVFFRVTQKIKDIIAIKFK